MIVLHAAFLGRSLLIWGESSPDATARPARKGRRSKTARAQPHPFAASEEPLRAALQDLGLKKGEVSFAQAVVWLPSVGSVPLASSPMIAEPPSSDAEAVVLPWTVNAAEVTGPDLICLLCACVGKHMVGPGVIVGHDLAYWSSAMRFAGALAAREQFLPGLAEFDGKWLARWQPVFTGRDAERLAIFSNSMPAACRAAASEPAAAPDTPAVSVLRSFLEELLDSLVRSGFTRRPTVASRTKVVFDSIHDEWLYKLEAADATMEGSPLELRRFAAQINEWRRPLEVLAASPMRLCFRLEEPPEDEAEKPSESWYVRFVLQALDDPSLMVPAKDAWNARGRKASVFSERGFSPREYLLSSLGQAAALSPGIEASLRSAAPEGYPLDVTGAYEFLTNTSPLLEQAGFGVMLPAWWTKKGTKLRLTAKANVKSPKMTGGSGLDMSRVLDVDWQLALGGQEMSYEELMALAELKSPLVKLRGQWVQINDKDIRDAIDFLKKREESALSARDVVRMALGAELPIGSVEIESVHGTGWIGELLSKLQGESSFSEVPPPTDFHGTLRPYQTRGYSWLEFLGQWGLGACLADDMGLGKTVQTLALIERNRESGERRPALLICPMSVVGNWQKEAAKFTPELPVMVHHGAKRTKGATFKKSAEKHALVVSSYSLLHRDIEILKAVDWSGVILDEAQNIKNPETRQSQAARSLSADYRIALTGTPVENNVGDLWSIMEFLNPGFLGTQAEFKRNFFVPIQAQQDEEAAELLKRSVGPFILRRLKTDKSIIRDLPKKMEMDVFCNLTREQASLYAAVTKELEENIESSEGIERKGMVLATLSKLKQVCNHPAQFLGDNSSIPNRSGKLSRLMEMLEEMIEVDDRALVFTQFAEMGFILQRHVEETFGREVLLLHGGVPKKQRDAMVERFQNDGDGPPVFVLSLKAGGTGLNLTRANHVFHFDRWWNPAVENQATDRAFRIGQTRNVQVHKFLCMGTLEEKIAEMIERKKAIAGNVVGTGEAWLTELSNSEIKEILKLGKEAVGD